VNRVQVVFLILLAVVLLVDVLVAAALAAAQGSGFVATLRIVVGMTGIVLLAGGFLMSGSSRAYPTGGSEMNSPVLLTRRFQGVMLQDREAHAVTVSDYPVVGVLHGAILCAVAFLLTFVPGV